MTHKKFLLFLLCLSVSQAISFAAAAPVTHDNFNLPDGDEWRTFSYCFIFCRKNKD